MEYRNPASTEHKIVEGDCCCGGPCACIDYCPEGYGIRLLIPIEHQPFITSEEGPRCNRVRVGSEYIVGFEHIVEVHNEPDYAYGAHVTLDCYIIDDVAIWHALQSVYGFYVDGAFVNNYRGDYFWPAMACTQAGVPRPGAIEWEVTWFGDGNPVPGFPLDAEVFQNPFP